MSTPNNNPPFETAQALDPMHSVVVEACAGSGKTWLLASRIVRLLLSGIKPGEILAITFTRKAAREIEERIMSWLRELATGSDRQVTEFLKLRGVDPDAQMLHTTRNLYEQVLIAQPGLTVNTFHGWFLQLIASAPLSAQLSGMKLKDSGKLFFDEQWQGFADHLQKNPESPITHAFLRLLEEPGEARLCEIMRNALDKRCEWLSMFADRHQVAEKIMDSLGGQLAVSETGEALKSFFANNWKAPFFSYRNLLEKNALASEEKLLKMLDQAFLENNPDQCFTLLKKALMTEAGTPRIKKHSKTMEKRLGVAETAQFIALHYELAEQLIQCLEGQKNEAYHGFNREVCTLFAAFLDYVDDFKTARRIVDFHDVEYHVLKMLQDEEQAAFLQTRLDARYRHVLLDEFQDTSPLQWQILLCWLNAYSDNSRPGVFLVGDPKQSIYRFRRAEPRIFAIASRFFEQEYSAIRLEQDVTRRNAAPVIDVVNEVFGNLPKFDIFRPHATHAVNLPGRVELIALVGKNEAAMDRAEVMTESLRNPLFEPEAQKEDLRRRQEASLLAEKIGQMVGQTGPAWLIEETRADGASISRPAGFGDIMLLVRSRSHLHWYEQALAHADIPFQAGSMGGLLKTLEASDMVALLEFLVTPMDNLKLAHVLKTPIFACSDDDLIFLSEQPEPLWWDRLQTLDVQGKTSACLERACRLLNEWLQAAASLPAHDLLDKIYHEGEVLARYCLSVPKAKAAAIVANLQELLLFALDADEGRYPSLPRFIDNLRMLHEADAKETPDEGMIESEEEAAGRVRILTIHGAKGLESPIVWLLDANSTPRGQSAWDILIDWPPEQASPTHFSFFGKKETRPAILEALFSAEAAANEREESNLLYVALTRAKQVFIASGIEGTASASATTPYAQLNTALEKLGNPLAYGNELPLAREKQISASPIAMQEPSPPLPRIGERRVAMDENAQFGVLVHALLEQRTAGMDGGIAPVIDLKTYTEQTFKNALVIVERILSAPHLQQFFDATQYRRAWNEVDLTSSKTALKRIDRLVEFEKTLWVLDYKSSYDPEERLESYLEQVSEYCIAVSKIFPAHKVRGGLILADASLKEVNWPLEKKGLIQ